VGQDHNVASASFKVIVHKGNDGKVIDQKPKVAPIYMPNHRTRINDVSGQSANITGRPGFSEQLGSTGKLGQAVHYWIG
jgi:hypothetical protein